MYLKIPAGKHIMDLVAVDWFKDSKRIDHVARRQGCAAQVLCSILFPLLCLLNLLIVNQSQLLISIVVFSLDL